MHDYTISFIDGHDLKFKTTTLKAETPQQVVYDFFQTWHDFDHTIITIKEDNKIIYER